MKSTATLIPFSNWNGAFPTDSYDLDEAVAGCYLVPPKAVSVPLRFQREGIHYDDLSDEEKEHGTLWNGQRMHIPRKRRRLRHQ